MLLNLRTVKTLVECFTIFRCQSLVDNVLMICTLLQEVVALHCHSLFFNTSFTHRIDFNDSITNYSSVYGFPLFNLFYIPCVKCLRQNTNGILEPAAPWFPNNTVVAGQTRTDGKQF